jgi:hypothetical protein
MGTVMLKDSVVRDNLTTHAGGGIDSDGIVFSSRSAVSGNVASGEGGSIRSYGTLILVGSTVSGNRSGNYGGGIANHGDLALDNSTVSGNWAANGGGGLSSSGPYYTVSLNSSTVASNTAPAGGGVSNMSSSVMLQDTIIAGNSGGDCDGTLTSAGYNLIGSSAGCTFTPAVGDRVNVDPKLGPLEGMPGWHPLLAGSPAIDAGNPVGCTDHLDQPLWRDQRGFPRFGRCDIGAYEYGWMEVFRIYLPMVRK